MTIEVDRVSTSNFPSIVPQGNAPRLVEDRFEATAQYADEAYRAITDDTDGLLAQWSLIIDNWANPPDTDVDYTKVEGIVLDILSKLSGYRPDRPNDADLIPATVDQPQDPDLAQIPTISVSEVPTFNEAMQPVTWWEPPDDDFPQDPGEPEAISRPGTVEKPVFTWPAEPTLREVSIPSAPNNVGVPEFLGQRPTAVLDPPVQAFAHTYQEYSSDLADALRNYLLNVVENGGDGLSDTVRTAIYDRAREQIRVEWDAEYTRILLLNRKSGGLSGATVARLDACNYKYLRELNRLNLEITIQDAERAWQNRQFAVEQGLAYEQAQLTYHNQRAQLVYQIALTTFQTAGEIFNRQVQAYQAKLAGYQADAQVYETLIRGANLLLERYRAQLEAAKIEGDLRQQDVALYTALLEARRTLAAVYTAQVDAQKAEMEVERLFLEAFKSRVDIWATKINALTAKWNLHNARLAGEQQKIDVYSKQVEAYTARVNAVRVEAEVERTKIDAITAKNASATDVFRARVDKYKADLDQAVERVKAVVQRYGVNIDEFKGWIQAVTEQQRAYNEKYQGDVQQSRNQTELEIKAAEVNLQAFLTRMQTEFETIRAKVNVLAQLAASAWSAVNATASSGSSANWSLSENTSWSGAVSNNMSISESHTVAE